MRMSALSEHNAEAKKQGVVAKIEGVCGENLKFSGEKLKFAGEKKSIHQSRSFGRDTTARVFRLTITGRANNYKWGFIARFRDPSWIELEMH